MNTITIESRGYKLVDQNEVLYCFLKKTNTHRRMVNIYIDEGEVKLKCFDQVTNEPLGLPARELELFYNFILDIYDRMPDIEGDWLKGGNQ